MRLVFSYCGGMYCTQIDNISREELSPRPLGLSILKILLHEYLLDNGVLYIIFGICNKLNDVLGHSLLSGQKWISLLWGGYLGGCRLNHFFVGPFFLQVSPCLGGFIRAVSTQVPLFFASKTSSFFLKPFTFVIIKGWTNVGSVGLDPSWCGVHSIVPLLLEHLFPLLQCWADFVLPLVMELRLDPHVFGVMLYGPSLPINESIWVVELGYIDCQGSREAFNKHINNSPIIEIIPAKSHESFESADIVIESTIPFHFEGFDVSLGIHCPCDIGECAEEHIGQSSP